MIDVEREVREVLERRGEEAAARAGDRVPADVHRRVRQRQARTVIMSGLAAALVAVGALAGARVLVPTTGREPGTGLPTPPPRLEEPTPQMTVVASGEFRGHSWRLTAGRNKEASCFGIETDTGGSSSCARDLLGPRFMEVFTHTSTSFPGIVVVGAVCDEIDRVLFDPDVGGQIEGTVYPTPKEMKASFDVFLLIIPEERPARGLVVAMNADGQVLARHGVYSDLGLFELEDAHGNVVGFIPAENPLWHEWATPGTTANIENIEIIRHVATFPLTSVWEEVRRWWDDRPPADASDDAFLDWWASYPVGGPRPARDADLVQLASGEFRGDPWNLIAFRRSTGPCLEATFALDPWPICTEGIPERFLLDFRVVGDRAENGNLLIGFVSSEADLVVVDVPGGSAVEARVLTVPFDPGLKAFVVEIEGHEGDLVALDRERDEVWRERFRLIPQTEG
jgi:hypothetical protein